MMVRYDGDGEEELQTGLRHAPPYCVCSLNLRLSLAIYSRLCAMLAMLGALPVARARALASRGVAAAVAQLPRQYRGQHCIRSLLQVRYVWVYVCIGMLSCCLACSTISAHRPRTSAVYRVLCASDHISYRSSVVVRRERRRVMYHMYYTSHSSLSLGITPVGHQTF